MRRDVATSTGGAATLLRAARATRASSGCAAALPRYHALIASYPDTPEAGEALLDSARCHAQLGRADEARAELQRAAGIAATAGRARQLLAPKPAVRPAAADTKP